MLIFSPLPHCTWTFQYWRMQSWNQRQSAFPCRSTICWSCSTSQVGKSQRARLPYLQSIQSSTTGRDLWHLAYWSVQPPSCSQSNPFTWVGSSRAASQTSCLPATAPVCSMLQCPRTTFACHLYWNCLSRWPLCPCGRFLCQCVSTENQLGGLHLIGWWRINVRLEIGWRGPARKRNQNLTVCNSRGSCRLRYYPFLIGDLLLYFLFKFMLIM